MNNLKSGFVSIVGRSNVGKSTLLNRIIGEKISIISNKPQTTRFNLKLIYNSLDSQIIFVDTPGVQNPKNKLGEFMLKESKNSLKDVDLILYMVDSNLEIGELDNKIIDILEKINLPKICVINKIDTLNSEDLSKIILKYEDINLFDKIIPISASEGTNVYNLIDSIKSFLPFGPRYYSDDMITDLTERDIVAEIIREKTLNLLRDEIPHGINILIEKFSLRKYKPIIDIDAVICVEKKSHKGMVIGKNGSMILKIGKFARLDIEKFLDSKVNLKLFVKIDDDWRSKSFKVKEFGYFDESYRMIDDHPFVLKYLREGNHIHFFDRCVIKYRGGGVSSAENCNLKYMEESDMIFANEVTPFAKNPKKILKQYMAWKRHRRLLNNYLIEKSRYENNRIMIIILQIMVRMKMPLYTMKRIVEKFVIERILNRIFRIIVNHGGRRDETNNMCYQPWCIASDTSAFTSN